MQERTWRTAERESFESLEQEDILMEITPEEGNIFGSRADCPFSCSGSFELKLFHLILNQSIPAGIRT